MSNQLRLLPTETSPRTDANARPEPAARSQRRRQRGPSAPAGRIDTPTRRAGRRGVAEARQALRAATAEAELRRAG